LVKTTISLPVAVVIIEMEITGCPNCGCDYVYDQIIATTTNCTPLSPSQWRVIVCQKKEELLTHLKLPSIYPPNRKYINKIR
jgi:hypothetical protein